MTVKSVIKKILQTTGWSQYRLAKEAGISRQMVSKWCSKGGESIRLDQLTAIKRASGITWKALGELIEAQVDSDSE